MCCMGLGFGGGWRCGIGGNLFGDGGLVEAFCWFVVCVFEVLLKFQRYYLFGLLFPVTVSGWCVVKRSWRLLIRGVVYMVT